MDIFGKEAKALLQAEIDGLKVLVDKYKSNADEFEKRCTDLENAFETEHGITVRQEITKVIADFSKVEMVVMIAAIASLIKSAGNPEDIKIYLNLNDKIQSLVSKMDERKEAPPA